MPGSERLESDAATDGAWEFAFFSDDWDGVPLSARHIAERLLPQSRIAWIETIGLRSPRWHAYDLKRVVEKAGSWIRRDASPAPGASPNLLIRNPFQIPYNRLGAIRGLNGRLLVKTAREALGPRRPGVRRALVTTCPFLDAVIGRIEEDVSVYYRVDDFSEFPGVDPRTIRTLERAMIDRVDFVAATARSLLPPPRPGRMAHYLPHGVDYEFFAGGDASRLPASNPLRALPAPRIGFFGLLSEWVDLELIDAVAARNPAWSVVLIGPTQLSKSELPRRPNLHYLGFVPYADLPHHAALFDVALIPFRVNALTQAVNPLKLLEYFALGLPVVSTPLPEVARYGEAVRIAGDPDEFSAAIASALTDDTSASRERRRQVARDASWGGRAAQLVAWLDEAEVASEGARLVT